MLYNFLDFSPRARRYKALLEYYLAHDYSEDEASEAAHNDIELEDYQAEQEDKK